MRQNRFNDFPVVAQFGCRAEAGEREIPHLAGENAGLRDDATIEKIQTVPVTIFVRTRQKLFIVKPYGRLAGGFQ